MLVIKQEIKNGIKNLGGKKIGSLLNLPDNQRTWLSDENILKIRNKFFETTCHLLIGMNNYISYDDETGQIAFDV